MKVEPPDWRGQTVVCIASGPSLTLDDCEAAKGHRAIVVNTSFRAAPWADVLFAHDMRWWLHYRAEVAEVFKGRRMSMTYGAKGVESLHNNRWFKGVGNSGACAIAIAVGAKAARVVLLGFDCQKTGGSIHWHGNHPTPLSNALSIDAWPTQFSRVAAHAKKAGLEVINASRDTALTCFERMPLESAL